MTPPDEPLYNWQSTTPEQWRHLKDFAYSNRKNPTLAEKTLWEHLRNQQLGVKFRRQHAIDAFIADFVCLPHKLVIEVDGGVHDQQKEYDQMRTELLNQCGFRVIRFTNDQVLQEIDSVLKEIRAALDTHP
ncbi:5-methyltetrahydrofolate--homocysteine methyltransferase/leucyl-tRNA synthetase/ATP-dependent DNA helicase RecG [Flexibacter flexilis DSM 6793]|uniref:5-methyltetrahydrofolate--homocysteine methyltransferase/leucyl-tRNA synthetase/ATP-dependent DNA helicase RecG n=1 Tax=Flexibacter flexilis DSM 6793 TaxID=927664 RepID=A0A1I1HYY7_9BACT|nr:endonuclease domain-containing protein [Flexibacter flexilis]SFC29096.1 5-methyltetrahydrofolate--homocysteine methyltransferase/leucyl-tRNA synthetase/ATP-dependent DNA helicase RecG [Flexibacter flexilis DSM 6793]